MSTSRPVRKPPSTCTAMPAAQPVQHQRLLSFGEADLPGRAGVLNRRERRRARAALEARKWVTWSARAFGDARRDRAHADLGAELHADPGASRVYVFQVEDELREILDGVDVVVRGRRAGLTPGVE